MLKLVSINKELFNNYLKECNNGSFYQTIALSEFSKVMYKTTSHYLALADFTNNNKRIVAAALFLEINTIMNKTYLYAPHGLVLNYDDTRLLSIFTNKLKDYAKRKKHIFISIEPNLEINDKNKKDLYHLFKSNDYKYKKNKNYLNKTSKEFILDKDISEELKNKLEISTSVDLEVEHKTYDDIDELYNLTDKYKSKEYFDTLYEVFNGDELTKVNIFTGKINISKIIKNLERDLKRTVDQLSILPIDSLSDSTKTRLNDLRNKKDLIRKEIDKYKDIKKDNSNEIILNTLFTIECNNTSYILFNYANDLLKEVNASYKVLYESINYYKNKSINKYIILDNNKIYSEFNIKEIEYIGRFDLVINPFYYFLYSKLSKKN